MGPARGRSRATASRSVAEPRRARHALPHEGRGLQGAARAAPRRSHRTLPQWQARLPVGAATGGSRQRQLVNILLVVSDQERERSWLPSSVTLPWRGRLLAEGLEMANHWTHSSPCSPSRATMMTGRYLPGHGVFDNCIFRHHTSLDTAIPTIGSVLRDAGWRSSYIGKWHLTGGSKPPMEAYGYSDWEGNDRHFMGWAGTGVHFDPVIAESAAAWLRT